MGQSVDKNRYFNAANKYAKDVIAGKVIACEFVKQACLRFLNDLKRTKWRYKLDKEKAFRACYFIELLPHIKGKWAQEKKLLKLDPWQIFIVVNIFGWIDRKTGNRRFSNAYVEVPRKNGKSTLSSGIALFMLSADGEEGAEVYSAATTQKQAQIVFNDAKKMAQRCKGLQRKYGVKTSAHSVYIESRACVFNALSRDNGGNLDGLNIHCAIIDELHAHKTRDIYDVIDSALGSREQPLMFSITTAGFNKAGICYENRDYAKKILDNRVDDDSVFAIIYTIDEHDDWTSQVAWQKANPNFEISIKPEYIENKCKAAKTTPAKENNFLTKHLNVWVNAATAWMNTANWDKQKTTLKIEDMYGCKAWLSIDLASKTDIAAIGILVEKDSKKYCFTKCYVPEETAKNNPNSQYSGWIRQGHLMATDGNVIDYITIENDIRELCDKLDVQQIAFDPWQAQSMMQSLHSDNLPVVEYPMRTSTMSEPMKEFEAGILKGDIYHGDNPCLDWQMSNVVAKEDANENIYPRKEFPENKIDAPVTLIMCIGLTMQEENVDVDDFINNIVIA